MRKASERGRREKQEAEKLSRNFSCFWRKIPNLKDIIIQKSRSQLAREAHWTLPGGFSTFPPLILNSFPESGNHLFLWRGAAVWLAARTVRCLVYPGGKA